MTRHCKTEVWYTLNPDPRHRALERKKAQKLKKSAWWQALLNKGICHYCEKKFSHLTMDHIVPVARGGMSTKGNIVPACKACNASKKLTTPAERLLKELKSCRDASGDDK